MPVSKQRQQARSASDHGLHGLVEAHKVGTDVHEIIQGDKALTADEHGSMEDISRLVSSVKYLVKDWIPYGMVTCIIAEPGVGKSAFVLWLVRSVVMAMPWFTGRNSFKQPKRVLWCATENDMAITIQRARGWGIPLTRMLVPFKEDPLCPIDLTDNRHLQQIEALVVQHQLPLVVIDSLRSGHSGDENSSAVGKVLQGLAGIAERTSTAIVLVHHTRKLTEGEEITANSSRGSNAILAMMRAQIGLDRPDPGRKEVRVRVLKENLGIAPQPVGFTVTTDGLQFGPPPAKPTSSSKLDKASEWLLKNLTPGEACNAGELEEAADQAGHAIRTLRRAADQIGVVREKQGEGWTWQLPSPPKR